MVSSQVPLGSPFGYRSTAREVAAAAQIAGKHALVTGGYSGIGTETVAALAQGGASVIVGARRPDQASEVLSAIDGDITAIELDLSDPTSIDAFCAKVAQRWDRIDILINNAAVMANPLTRDSRGFESQFATNHLGHFQLTARLWPLLIAAGLAASGARVVALSSIGHRLHGLDLEDLHWDRREYDKWTAYGAAKSANALFALHLDQLGEPQGVRAFSVHPGGIATPLQRHLTMEEQTAMGWYDADGNLHERFKTPPEGAATTLWAATSPLLDGHGGVYCEDCDIAAPFREESPASGVHPHVLDRDLAAALWVKSQELTGIHFTGAS
ncbi:MAG: oxidoreductase [Pseudomonadota bacterium]